MAVHDTAENDRTKYTKQTLESLGDTVDLTRHRVAIINNNSCPETEDVIRNSKIGWMAAIFYNAENIGTARGINQGLRLRNPNEMCCKIDNDVVIHQTGWVDELESTLQDNPHIGILGLKRDDIPQNPNHPDPEQRTIIDGKIEYCKDIMGTCTAFNPALLDKIGLMMQPSVYGFDDVLMSVRSLAAGFQNAFLPHIKITHLDDGLNPYCDWKRKEAGKYMGELGILCDMIRSGKMSYYYNGNI